MSRQIIKKRRLYSVKKLALAVCLVFTASLLVGDSFWTHAATCSSASDCQAQIDNLGAQNDQVQQQINSLVAQASSYQDAINQLQQQISQLQQQIVATQSQEDQLQVQINQAKKDLETQKKILGEDIKAMYLEGKTSTLEILASSNNLSDFVNKETYRGAVQDKVKTTLNQITALKQKLQKQHDQLDQLNKSLSAQQASQVAAQNKQNSLLSYNETQQSQFNSQVSTNQTQIAQLRAQQATMIQGGTRGLYIPPPSGGAGGLCDNGYGNGGYPMPWCNAAEDTVATIPYSSDPINRECTSYAYWYFSQIEGHSDFRAYGNANQWAATSNYVVHAAPAVGSIAVETGGFEGHVAIVQALPGQTYAGNTTPDGFILVSEMNYDLAGHFRYSFSPISKFAGYIYN